jgi:DNA repair photolyase
LEAQVELAQARSILTAATGFIKRGGFDWTCNPYVGCTFGCRYCYAMFLPQNRRPRDDWGRWFQVKANAVELARRQAPRAAGQAVYMSSVTDPYQPVERALGLTRGILEALAPHQPRLVIQTRGPLVVRDADILARFGSVRVNLSIPTDDEEIRKAFEPKAPPLEARWEAARHLKALGIPVGLCLTPLLPVADHAAFADRVAGFGAEVVVVQEFHDAPRGWGADTADEAVGMARRFDPSGSGYLLMLRSFKERGVDYHEGESGFFPPGSLGHGNSAG